MDGWISISEAARLVPSPRAARTANRTIHRWIDQGRLEARRRGCFRFVRRDQVLRLAAGQAEVQPQFPESPREQRAAATARDTAWQSRQARDAAILKAMGVA